MSFNMSLQNRKGNQNRNIGQNNMNPNQGQTGTGQRIRLRRMNMQQQIQENLSHMQQSAHKKKLAQELYYSNQGYRSPLLRTNIGNQKPSVHNRLGVGLPQKQVNKPFLTKNQGNNRVKLRRLNVQPEQIIKNNITRKKNQNIVKRLQNSAQNRILRIRQNNRIQNNPNQTNAGQKVRLRRMRPTGPVNYTVQVTNTNKKQIPSYKHNLNKELDPELQKQIRLIQNKNLNHDEIPSIPIHPHGTGFTGTTLNERFSQL